MRRMMNGEGCLQIPKEFLAVAGLNRETDVLIGMAPEVILITSKNLDEMKREKIRDALRSFSVDLDIPLLPEGVLLPEEMLLDAGLPCDPELLDMYLEDGRIVIEILEDFEEELLEEAWDEAQEDDVLSQLPAGLLDMFRCMKIDLDVVRDAIVGGGVQI